MDYGGVLPNVNANEHHSAEKVNSSKTIVFGFGLRSSGESSLLILTLLFRKSTCFLKKKITFIKHCINSPLFLPINMINLTQK